MLVYMPDDERRDVLSNLVLKRYTAHTVSSVQELDAELRRIRKQGFACDVEEHEQHVRCIAAPILDHHGLVNASVSITAPAMRMPVSRMRQLTPLVQAAASRISSELGHRKSASSPTVVEPAAQLRREATTLQS